MERHDTDWKAVPELRFLKTLVTGLTLVMGLGMVAVVALLWVRLDRPMLPELPQGIVLPQGAQANAVTFAPDRIVVLTTDDQVLVFDRAGALVGQMAISSRADR